MQLEDRIRAFSALGIKIRELPEETIQELAQKAKAANGWFSPESVQNALQGIAFMLEEEKLRQWCSRYALETDFPKIVGIIMAGNIPLVGFHDLLSVLISGNFAAIKPSSDDTVLVQTLLDWMVEIEPRFRKNIEMREKLTEVEAVIATGSDNTARYFEYYFGHVQHIIRKNRTSVAILTGKETPEDFQKLGEDIFSYYGLGCRNVSKVYTPEGYDLREVFPHLELYNEVVHHHKYRNNYDYNKSIYLVNKTPHLDTGFLLVTTSDELVSPISVLFHQAYTSEKELLGILEAKKEKIQCIVGTDHIPFGTAQRPELWDYADEVDTMAFLQNLEIKATN